MRADDRRATAAPGLALALALISGSTLPARAQSEPPISYEGGSCTGAMQVQDAKIRCNKSFK